MLIVCAGFSVAAQETYAFQLTGIPAGGHTFPTANQRVIQEIDSGNPFTIGYDNGFYIRKKEADPSFELRVKARFQMRHSGFAPTDDFFISRGGTVRPLDARNRFEMERVRLQFHGNVFKPELSYVFIIDGDNDERTQLDFLIYYFDYEWWKNHHVGIGREKNAASFEWIQSSRNMSLNDRSMATAFFRPSFSDGIWFHGATEDRQWFYRMMLSNGYNTTRLTPNEVDDRITPSGAIWWEPSGAFGVGYADLQNHQNVAWRFGASGIYAPHRGIAAGTTVRNELFGIRLADGTRLTETGAISPGVSVTQFDAGLASFLAAVKYRGFSLMGEYYFRWLTDLRADAPIDNTSISQHGFVVAGGMFFVPKTWEIVVRHSQVNGDYGSGYEYAGGLNWYIHDHDIKIQFDVTKLVQNPATDGGPDFRSGDDGVLIRTQVQLAF